MNIQVGTLIAVANLCPFTRAIYALEVSNRVLDSSYEEGYAK